MKPNKDKSVYVVNIKGDERKEGYLWVVFWPQYSAVAFEQWDKRKAPGLHYISLKQWGRSRLSQTLSVHLCQTLKG